MHTSLHTAPPPRALPFALRLHPRSDAGPAGFGAGARVMTEQGAQPVEALLAGDRIQDGAGQMHELRGLTARRFVHGTAIRIAPGALETDWQLDALLVGAGQLLALSNWRTQILGIGKTLLPAARLTDELGVSTVVLPQLTLYTLHFDAPATILANGIEAGVQPLNVQQSCPQTVH